MASSELAFDPLSYHCGSVWPHDNAVIAAGLARYGHVEAFHRVVAPWCLSYHAASPPSAEDVLALAQAQTPQPATDEY